MSSVWPIDRTLSGTTMKVPTNGRFCWFCRSSSDVDPVVNSHTRPCGHFTGCTKKPLKKNNKQQTVGGRKKQTNRNLELQKTGKWSWYFSILFMYAHGYRKNSVKILHSYQICWLISSLSSLLSVLTSCSRVSLPTDCPRVSLLIDCPFAPKLMSFVLLSSDLAGFRGHNSLCGLHTKVDKEVSLDTLTLLQRCWR